MKKKIISVLLAFFMFFNMGTKAYAAEAGRGQERPENIVNENFIPSRSEIPMYLSQFSSYKGEMIKGIWAKLFYEELTFDDGNYRSWYQKYNHGISKDGQVPVYYLALGGHLAQVQSQITYSAGDFETFFGNSLKANPEFLGQMLGLPGYAPLGQDRAGNELMRQVMVNYLLDPCKYKALAKRIGEITYQGDYIGDSKTSDNNILKGESFGEYSLDIYVLMTLASLYEGDGDEAYLSDIQLAWLRSYERFLYDDYVDRGENSLARQFPSIYDLIARSVDASNNYRGLGQEFFDYVEESARGAGSWLNQIEGVDIEGLDDLSSSISSIFDFADGYCYGHEDNCKNHDWCLAVENGGRAKKIDDYAYLISKSPEAMVYIKANENTAKAYSNPNSKDGGWLEKYNMRHGSDSSADHYFLQLNIVSGGNGENRATAQCDRWSRDSATARTSATARVDLTKIDALALENFGEEILSRTDAITVSMNGGHWTGSRLQTGNTGGGCMASYSRGGYSVSSVTGNVTNRVVRSGNTFNISDLSLEERASAVISVSHSATSSVQVNGQDGSGNYSATGIAKVSTSPTATLSVKRAKCFQEGHDWAGKVDWDGYFENASGAEGQRATIAYTCKNDVSHVIQIQVPVTSKREGDYMVYTASAAPFVYDSQAGGYDTYSIKINATNGDTRENIKLLSGDNVSGNTSDSKRSSTQVFPQGSVSKYHYTMAVAKADFTVQAGTIKAGAKRIKFNVSASEELHSLSIKVYDRYGEIIAVNDVNDPYSCYIVGKSDGQLRDCYAVVSAVATTQHFNTRAYAQWEDAPESHATIIVSSMDIYYK
ncbi:MAG: hypothetical protein K5773_08725 [Pseudobutyrivibrio sp.]|nr:hypothetical protein [Pseudobutyrivibrio sp.]